MMWRLISCVLLRARMTCWQIVYKGYRSQYDIDRTFRFNGAGIQLYGDGRIVLGEGSYLGELSTIQAASGLTVTVGRRCSISHNVRIYSTSAVADADFRTGPAPSIEGSVNIEDGAWIGANAYIGPGITIGANAAVGANSVVTHSVPPSEIWGGVPARFIRRKNESRLGGC